jgi:mRNA interferase MazF
MKRRGEIWVANLNPGRGREISKIRPVLVIQDDSLTASGTPMVVILPLSTQVYPSFKRWRITITPRDRLLKPCQVIVDQPRVLDLGRFGEGPLTSLTAEEMAEVEKSLKGILGLL